MKEFFTLVLIILFGFLNLFAHNADSVFSLKDNTINDSVTIDSYYELSNNFRTSNLAEAIIYAEKGIDMARGNNDLLRIVKGLYFSGKSYAEMGLYDEAISDLTEMQEISENINYHKGYLEAIISIGTVFSYRNDKESALDFYKKALEYMNKNKCYDKAFAIYLNIGMSFNYLNQRDSLFYYLNKARLILETQGDETYSIGHIYLNIGSLYLFYNQPDSGEFYLYKALEYSQRMRTISRTTLYSVLAEYEASKNNVAKSYIFLDSCYQNAITDQSVLSKRTYFMTKIRLDSINNNYHDALLAAIELNKINYSFNEKNSKSYKEYYNLKIKEREFENLKKENEIIRLNEKQDNNIITILFIAILFISIITIIYRRANRSKKGSIKTLSQMNERLMEQHEELKTLNNQLSLQKEGLEKTQAQLIQSEKMASLGVMAAGISHEINNPLNYINGGLFLFEKIRLEIDANPEIAPQFEQSYKMIEEGLLQIHNVVKVINQFAENKIEQIEHNDINVIIINALEQLNFKIKDDIIISQKFSDIPLIDCDYNKVKQVFIQLLSNAIDATVEIEQRKIDIHTHTTVIDNESYVAVRISNSGYAIDNESIGKIFDPFFTTKSPNKGYGLGLSIVYNLMKEIGGKVLVSNIEHGVEFLALFPINLNS